MPAQPALDAGIKKHDRNQKTADDYMERGELGKAIELSRENLAWSEKNLGLTDLVTLADRDSLAFALNENATYREAITLDEGTLLLRKKRQGPEDEETLETQHNLALNYFNVGRYQEAADLDQKTVKARASACGQEHADTLSSRHNLAASLQELKQHKGAECINREVLKIRERICCEDDPELISSRHNLAANLYGVRYYGQAARLLRENLRVLRKVRSEDDKQLATCESLLELNNEKWSEQSKKKEEKEERMKKKKKDQEEEKKKKKEEEEKMKKKKEEQEKEKIKKKKKEEAQEKMKVKREEDEKEKMKKNKKEEEDVLLRHLLAKTKNEKVKSAQEKDTQTTVKAAGEEHVEKTIPKTRNKTKHELGHSDSKDDSKNNGIRDDKDFGISSTRPKRSDQLAVHDKAPLPIEDESQDVHTENEGSSQKRGSLSRDSETSNALGGKKQRLKAKSDQDIGRSSASRKNLEIPNENPQRRLSVGASQDKNLQSTGERRRTKSREPPTVSPVINVLSKFYDAHISEESPYILDAADKWFEDLSSDTQQLLEPHRKDRMKRVKIAILDTGIDRTHTDIEAKWSKHIRGVRSWVNGEGGDVDRCGHGTHGAALLMRIAPEAHIYVARVAKDHSSPLDPDSVAQAIKHASDEWKVDIITMSFGFPQRYLNILNAIRNAWGKSTIIFAAASNDGARRKIAFPANLSSMVMCINSADGGGARSRYNPPAQDTGHNFSVLGESVSSAWPTKPGKGAEKRQSGTSTSTPIAAAIAALILEFEKQPNLSISHRTTLKSLDGMREIFSNMSESKDGYNFIVPWKLLHQQSSRVEVASRLSWIMNEEFGPEAP